MINSRALLFLLLSFYCMAQVRPVRPPARTVKTPIAKPFTLDKLLSRLQDVANKEYTEGALIRRVEKDGVEFNATEANLSRLTHAGASPTFIEMVKRMAPVVHEPPPVIAKPDPTGDVEVSCEPAECFVRFGSATPIATSGGKLVRRGLKHGAVPIEVTRSGFRPFRSTVVIQGGTVEVKALLQPDLELRRKWGADLKAKVIEAIGGEARLKSMAGFLASGEATVWGQGGRKYSSSLELFIRAPDKAFFRTTSGKRSLYEVDFLPRFRSRSNLPEEESRDLDAGMRLFSKYQLYAVISRLNNPDVQLSSETGDKLGGAELHAETSTEKDVLVLNSEGKPQEIREDVPLGSGVRALFSSYRNQDGLSFPGKVTIVWAGTAKRGIEIDFHSIEINPKLKNENKYRLKKGNRAERR